MRYEFQFHNDPFRNVMKVYDADCVQAVEVAKELHGDGWAYQSTPLSPGVCEVVCLPVCHEADDFGERL